MKVIQKVLVVEDEAILQLLLEKMLLKMGIESIEKTSSGEKAIELSKNTHFDLILMDIMLNGEIDGIEAFKEIKSFKSIPVIYITGNSNLNIKEKANKIGYHEYISKPLTYLQLKKSISALDK